jgi:hypothetical protein
VGDLRSVATSNRIVRIMLRCVRFLFASYCSLRINILFHPFATLAKIIGYIDGPFEQSTNGVKGRGNVNKAYDTMSDRESARQDTCARCPGLCAPLYFVADSYLVVFALDRTQGQQQKASSPGRGLAEVALATTI